MSCGEHPLDCITDHLAPALDGRATGPRQWSAICPACGGEDRKLSISLGERQRIVLKCHRGHTYDEIREALPPLTRKCLKGSGRHRKPGTSAELKRITDFVVDQKLPAAALRLGLLIEMGIPADEARKMLNLTKPTYYRAMKQLPTRS